jgi:hypothetical protein
MGVTSEAGGFAVNIYKKNARFGWPRHDTKDAANLLEALEALRVELGSVGEDIITIMREAGITPPEESGSEDSSPSDG